MVSIGHSFKLITQLSVVIDLWGAGLHYCDFHLLDHYSGMPSGLHLQPNNACNFYIVKNNS